MTVSIDPMVRSQVLFREVNERLRELVEHFDATSEVTFICECSSDDCGESIALRLDEYMAIRSSPTLFLIAPGHETPNLENVVETNDRFALVENIRKLELVTESHQPESHQPVTERQA